VRKERGERERELGKKGRKDRGKKEEEKVHVVTDSLIFLFLSTLHGITSRAISMEAGGRCASKLKYLAGASFPACERRKMASE